MDVALDPIPYGGATTTAEALWMGVPVVSLRGEGMVGRLSASLLHHAGFEQWIANDIDAYVDIAKNLAAARTSKQQRAMQLRNALERSALADGGRLSAELERIYRTLRTRQSATADLGLHHISECLFKMMHQIGGITQWAGLNLLTPAVSIGTELVNIG